MGQGLPEGMSLVRTSTARQVASAIRERILNGELPPGTPLREVELAASLGVSRNTVREGIRDLVNEGLLRHQVHRGVTVASLNAAQVHDLYGTRKVLESAALRFASVPSEEQLTRLNAYASDIQRAASAGAFAEIIDADFRFHGEVVALLGVQRISDLHRSSLAELRLELYRLDQGGAFRPGDWARQHREIVRLLGEGKRAAAARLIDEHLSRAESELVTAVSPQGDTE